MDPTTIELMQDHVRAIYRALTGNNLPVPDAGTHVPPAPPVSQEELARSFATLEAMARAIPAVMERVPPFSFAPAIDVIHDERELLIEAALPGVLREDLTVTRNGELLMIAGVRKPARVTNGRSYVHAEIPCGPFYRVVHLPYPVFSEPRVEVENGLVRIHLAKTPSTSPARA